MTQKKNKEIIKIFEIMRENSIIEYEDIDPNNYMSPNHFLRLFYAKYSPMYDLLPPSNVEKPQVAINKYGFGYIVLPQPIFFKNSSKEIGKLSKKLLEIENQIKGWVIDLRSNTGGLEYIYLLFIMIFVPIKYQGLLFSLIKDDDNIIHDVSVYNGVLHMRNKYNQSTSSIVLKNVISRLTKKRKINILVDKLTGSGSEYVCLVLKSFGAQICSEDESTLGILNLTVGYLINDVLSMYFPNAHVYDRNKIKQDIYIKVDKKIKPQYLLP